MSVHSLFFQSPARSFANLSLKPRTENFPFVCVYISCCSSFQFSSDKVKALVSYWIWKFAVVFLYGQDRLYITHWYVLVNLLSGPLFGSGFIHILAKYFFRGMKLVLIQITRYRAQSIDHGVATFMKVKQPTPMCRDVMEIRNGLLSGATSFMDFFFNSVSYDFMLELFAVLLSIDIIVSVMKFLLIFLLRWQCQLKVRLQMVQALLRYIVCAYNFRFLDAVETLVVLT